MADYIPAPDAEFDGWQANWVTYAVANALALGLDPLVDIPAILLAQTAWDTDYDGHLTAQAAAQAARAAKDTERETYVADSDGADANKVAHYMLRWESTRGETGPWSETASATIGA